MFARGGDDAASRSLQQVSERRELFRVRRESNLFVLISRGRVAVSPCLKVIYCRLFVSGLKHCGSVLEPLGELIGADWFL